MKMKMRWAVWEQSPQYEDIHQDGPVQQTSPSCSSGVGFISASVLHRRWLLMAGCLSLQASSSLCPSPSPQSYSSSSSQPSVPVGSVRSQSVLGCETCSSRSADLRTKKKPELSWRWNLCPVGGNADRQTATEQLCSRKHTHTCDEASNRQSDMFHISYKFWLSEDVWNVERETVSDCSELGRFSPLSEFKSAHDHFFRFETLGCELLVSVQPLTSLRIMWY